MISLMAYLMRSYTRSQRYFAPLSGMVIAVLVLYSYKPNPVMNSYAATAVILFIGCAAMGLSFLNHEHAVQRQVVIVHLRSARIYSIGGILSLTLLALLLDVMIVVYPMITGRFSEPVGIYRFLLALIGHGLLGLLGISISLFLQSSWVAKRSHAVGLMLAIIILSIGGTQISSLLKGPLIPLRLILPPVAPVMNALMNGDTLPGSSMLLSFVHVSLYIFLLIGIYLFRSGTKDYSRI
ncbi:hypothetical protein [Paenibacillus wynnii]|uniref:hypothetical protein n=1 Tax=Paenibacillus wynnii TaxID=268407 RepID=UPI00278EE200|nr:hypothetical protein [Paenibacillus wynnii]MDQ0193338.1 hypothetical protein [Paenibacillus wynnii]